MKKQTSKKVKVIGTQQYINHDTGEIIDMNVINIEERDFNFHKLWLSHIISSLDLIGNKKVKLAFWIVENLNKDNQLIMTYRQIAEKSGLSIQTVTRTMQALLDSNFLAKINGGAYQINPNVIFKGTHNSRLNILYQYNQIKAQQKEIELSPKEKKEQRIKEIANNLSNLQEHMNNLLKELNDLQNKEQKLNEETE